MRVKLEKTIPIHNKKYCNLTVSWM